MRHINIPVFIPHLGCPNLCVFCNQRAISGACNIDESNILYEAEKTVSDAIKTVSPEDEVEIAFFGGSFTGIDRNLMISLLDMAQRYINGGFASYIRMSTRPDYIDDEVLTILSSYSVKYIELGVQSMNDRVLEKCKRGHTSKQSVEAINLIKNYGFLPVGQMMTGLPDSSISDEINTAGQIIKNGAVGTRIYPTMVFGKTELQFMSENGEYDVPSLENLVSRSASVLEYYLSSGVEVLKIGLHSGETLYGENGICTDNYHPAMGEMISSRVFYRRICQYLVGKETAGCDMILTVSKGFISKALGNGKENKEKLINRFGFSSVKVKENEGISEYGFNIILRRGTH